MNPQEAYNKAANGEMSWTDAIEIFKKDPRTALQYSKRIGRFLEAEEFIKDDAVASYEYATYNRHRFELAEPTISQNAQCAYFYARQVLGDRFELAEPTLSQNAQYAYQYACYPMRARWPIAEPVIAKDAESAYQYARDVIKDRFVEAEPIIAKSNYACNYAKDIIKGRFLEAEEFIKNDAYQSYNYAKYVIKGRFAPAEDIIKKHISLAYEYIDDVIKGRWKEAESYLLNGKKRSLEYCIKYNAKLPEQHHNKVLAEIALSTGKIINVELKRIYVSRIGKSIID